MSYDYKILNTDPTTAFIKRVVLYIAILSITVSLALVILYILFERYLMLILPGVTIALSIVVFLVIGRMKSSVSYHFSDKDLVIQSGKNASAFAFCDLTVVREAEQADFANKEVKICTFLHHRMVLKDVCAEEELQCKAFLVSHKDQTLILALDDYALALIGGDSREV